MLKIDQFQFSYPGTGKTVLSVPHLEIPANSFTGVFGPSGGGKSTLLRLTNGLVPHFSGGVCSGSITVNGIDPIGSGPQVMCKQVGFVFQEPENQFVVDVVEDEIAFTLENHGFPRDKMLFRIETVLEQLNISHLRKRKQKNLSGGEAQRVAIAAAMVLQPRLLVLDEPTSQLDPAAAGQVLKELNLLRQKTKLSILIAEHRVDRVLPYCDYSVIVPGGDAPTVSGLTRAMLPILPYQPPITKLFFIHNIKPYPLSVEEARINLHRLPKPASVIQDKTFSGPGKEVLLSVQDLNIQENGKMILKNINFQLNKGEQLVIIGPNGAGKSTLLRSIVGLRNISSGEIRIHNQSIKGKHTAQISKDIGLLPQDPNALLFSETVTEEISHTLKNHHKSEDRKEIPALLEQLHLKEEGSRYPRDLSSGERQRVALGAVCITKPSLLLLDEPTRGLDPDVKTNLINLLKSWNKSGTSFIMVTHDVEFAASFATRVILLENGLIKQDGAPHQVFSENPDFTPQLLKLFPDRPGLSISDFNPS